MANWPSWLGLAVRRAGLGALWGSCLQTLVCLGIGCSARVAG